MPDLNANSIGTKLAHTETGCNTSFLTAQRKPFGFAAFIRHSPDGLRRSANKVIAICRKTVFCKESLHLTKRVQA